MYATRSDTSVSTVHPHVCGEHAGTTPLCSFASRFIPTCVGNMGRKAGTGAAGSVHPHVCGEHSGESEKFRSCSSVHPHVCGEHVGRKKLVAALLGSSPRVWGTCHTPDRQQRINAVHPHVCGEHPPTAHAVRSTARFIPTCVGNITTFFLLAFQATVHPHVCGEHSRVLTGLDLLARFIPTCVGNMSSARGEGEEAFGSSPRVWGTFPPHASQFVPRRFIPTCVGNMRPATLSASPSPVHPHVCGEHFITLIHKYTSLGSSPRVWGTCGWSLAGGGAVAGSSPRVWGTFHVVLLARHAERFIPTCVGNMPSAAPPAPRPSVHPHVCGEHWRRWRLAGVMARFIPTCVGNM